MKFFATSPQSANQEIARNVTRFVGRSLAAVAIASVALSAGTSLINPAQADALELFSTESTTSTDSSLTIASCVKQIQAQAEQAAAEQATAVEAAKPSNVALETAYSLIDTPYRYGGCTPAGFDCSGFTMYCYAQAGIDLTHNAAAQYNEGEHVDYEDLQPGDLVFFGGRSITHVGIYVGDGNYIHSPQTGEYVRVDSLADRNNYVGACRVA